MADSPDGYDLLRQISQHLHNDGEYLEDEMNSSPQADRNVYGEGANTPGPFTAVTQSAQGNETSYDFDLSYSPTGITMRESSSIEYDSDGNTKVVEYGSTFLMEFAVDARTAVEAGFHSTILRLTLLRKRNGDDSYFRARHCESDFHQAELARLFHDVSDESLQELEATLSRDNDRNRSQALASNAYEARHVQAERDLWRLLDVATHANVLEDVNAEQCKDKLEQDLKQLPVFASDSQVFDCAVNSDLRFKKVLVIRQWLEKAVERDAFEVPTSNTLRGIPWQDTMAVAGRCGPNDIVSVHPDAQIAQDGLLLDLKGSDEGQHIKLLSSMWSLVRCGKNRQACHSAYKHQALWLFTSLSGSLEDPGSIENNDIMSDGSELQPVCEPNTRRSLWQNTAWAYADYLASCKENLVKGRSSAYEMAIYATLSGNAKALLQSPTMDHWRDRLWALVVAIHKRDWEVILHLHAQRQLQHSDLYIVSEKDNRETAEKILEKRWSFMDQFFCVSDCDSLLEKSSLPDISDTASAAGVEAFLLSAQAAVLRGRTGLDAWIRDVMKPTIDELQNQNNATRARLARVCCHLSLWLRLSHTFVGDKDLSELTDEVHYNAIKLYVTYLVETGQRGLVAAYVVHLPQARRVREYAFLLRSISLDVSSSQDAMRSALADADQYFTNAEVLLMAKYASRNDEVEGEMASLEQEELTSLGASHKTSHIRQKKGPSGSTHSTDGSKRTVGSFEDMRLQNLKWLLCDPAHRLEAIHCSTRVLAAIMREDKSTNKKHFFEIVQKFFFLLDNLSDNSATVGEELLKQSGCDERSQWNSNLNQLQFWRSCLSAFIDVDKALESPKNKVDIAERASQKLLYILSCKLYYPKPEARPDMWYEAEWCAVLSAKCALDDVLKRDQEGDIMGIQDATFFDDELSESLSGKLESFSTRIATVFEDVSGSDKQKEMRKLARGDLEKVYDGLKQYLASNREPKHLKRLRIAIDKCEEALKETEELREVWRLSILLITSRYLDVCAQTAESLQISLGSGNAVQSWHARGTRIADILADPSMDLFHILPTKQMKIILSRIGNCAFEATHISGKF